jgi:hypothetical protein
MHITALDIYTSAIIVDSAVTLGVGYWLNRTAKKQVKSAVDDIGPAIQRELKVTAEEYARQAKQEIARSIQKLVPVILKAMKNASRTTSGSNSESVTNPEPVWDEQKSDAN